MDSEQYNLSNLRDIVIPDPPPFWPLAPGAWVALAIIVAVVLFVGWRLYTTRKRNAYRSAGLLLLSGAKTVHDVSVVMKRVALAAFPRELVASLYGEDWVAFLQKTCSRADFTEIVRTDAGAESDQELIGLAGVWIRYHRVPESPTPTASR